MKFIFEVHFIFTAIYLQVAMSVMNNKVQLSVAASMHKMSDNVEPVRLQINHLLGVFGMWWIGLGISLIVFVFELVWYHKIRLVYS